MCQWKDQLVLRLHQKMNSEEATNVCQQMGFQLLSIDSQEQVDSLRRTFLLDSESIWLDNKTKPNEDILGFSSCPRDFCCSLMLQMETTFYVPCDRMNEVFCSFDLSELFLTPHLMSLLMEIGAPVQVPTNEFEHLLFMAYTQRLIKKNSQTIDFVADRLQKSIRLQELAFLACIATLLSICVIFLTMQVVRCKNRKSPTDTEDCDTCYSRINCLDTAINHRELNGQELKKQSFPNSQKDPIKIQEDMKCACECPAPQAQESN